MALRRLPAAPEIEMPRRHPIDRPLTAEDMPAHRVVPKTGIGRVRWKGRTIWTCKWTRCRKSAKYPTGWKPSAEAAARYNEICDHLMNNGGLVLLPEPGKEQEPAESGLLLLELVEWYRGYCRQRRYRGSKSSLDKLESVMKITLAKGRGEIPITQFSRRHLAAIRNEMLAKGWSRSTTNAGVSTIKAMFETGCSEKENVPDDTVARLARLKPLRPGPGNGAEARKVLPCREENLERIKPHLSRVVAAMIEVQLRTGMRPGEVCMMRPCDLDMSDKEIWIYRPARHKTERHGVVREIHIGPRAQAAIAPFLANRPTTSYLFSPRESAAEYRARRTASRKTPASCGNSVGSLRRRRPRRVPGEKFTTSSYRRAIQVACERVGITPGISPNQIRHLGLTLIRRKEGLDAAQAAAGHRTARMTETYAEVDATKARTAVAKIG